MPRILSRHGNVIAAEFRPASPDLTINIKSEILYQDGSVLLMRTTALIDDQTTATLHFLADMKTGSIVHLNNKDVTP